MRQDLGSLLLVLGFVSVTRGASAQISSAPDRSAAFAPAPPPPPAEPRSTAVRFTLSPEWGYRAFRDVEPSSTDKRYNARGILGAAARLELYPLAFVSPAIAVAKDFGITASYSRAFGLSSRDVDTGTEVDSQWYQFAFGARYRILGGTRPLALGFTAGLQRWVYEFDTNPPSRLIPVAKYLLLPVGADVRYAFGPFSLFADGRFLLPLTVAPLGNRSPSGGRFGAHLALGAAFGFLDILEVEVRAAYTMLYISLPTVGDRADERGVALDQYVVLSAGATILY
jgi:hypothetical protein